MAKTEKTMQLSEKLNLNLKKIIKPLSISSVFKKHFKLKTGALWVMFFLFIALLCPIFIDYSEEVIKHNQLEKYMAPNHTYWFGTDEFGRNIFFRVIWGTRRALCVAVSAVMLGLLVGVPFGMFSGYWGGWRDEFLMRINDAFLSIPVLMLALLIIVSLGSNIFNLIFAIAITFIPRIARVMRSCTISLKNEQFVIAAEARGEPDSYIVFREIFPNVMGPMIVEGGVRIGYSIIIGASLSFLGLGSQPPQPDWGLMIFEARRQVFLAPWALIFPSIALVLMILGFNLLGDGLRDALDPKEKSIGFID